MALPSQSTGTFCSAQNRFDLVDSLNLLEIDQEYRCLKHKVGLVSIILTSCQFLASSNSIQKCIFLDPALFQKRINKIYPLALESILFEMCNLEQTDKIESLVARAGILTPDEFVEKYERIEYQSALKTRQFLRKCLPPQIWRQCPMAVMYTGFRPHYLMQQAVSHSQKIWERFSHLFDEKSIYRGNWEPVPEDEKSYVAALIACRAGEKDLDLAISSLAKKEYKTLKDRIIAGNEKGIYSRLANRLSVIEFAFSEDNP